jgi:DNA-binding MarR family transcriptional regulator
MATDGTRFEATRPPTPEEVLETFSPFQARSARLVAEDLGIDRESTVELLDELTDRGVLTKVHASSDTPVWLRRTSPRTPA